MFKTVSVKLDGFKGEKFYLKELSIRQANEVMACQGGDIDILLTALKYSLIDEDSNRVITPEYSVEQLADDLPQSYLNLLAEAYAELNKVDDLGIAKKS